MGFQIRLICRMLPDAGRGGHADLKDESLLLDTHGGDGKRDFPFFLGSHPAVALVTGACYARTL